MPRMFSSSRRCMSFAASDARCVAALAWPPACSCPCSCPPAPTPIAAFQAGANGSASVLRRRVHARHLLGGQQARLELRARLAVERRLMPELDAPVAVLRVPRAEELARRLAALEQPLELGRLCGRPSA